MASTASPSIARSRLYAVDVQRSIGAALVLAVHLDIAAGQHGLNIPDLGDTAAILWGGFVDNSLIPFFMFFATSGFLITRLTVATWPSFGDIDPKAFYVARAARILPALLLAIVVGGVAIALQPAHPSDASDYCIHAESSPLDFSFWASLVTFSSNWLRIHRGSWSLGLQWEILWSLAIEEQYYLVYPWFLRALKTRRRVCIGLACVATMGPLFNAGLLLTHHHSVLTASTNSFVGLSAIALGDLSWFVMDEIERRGWIAKLGLYVNLLGIGGFAALVFAVYAFSMGNPTDAIFVPSLSAAATCCMLIAWGRPDCWQFARIISQPGKHIYAAYLAHPLLLYALWRVIDGRHLFTCWFVLTVSSFGFAALLNRYYERPVARLIFRAAGRLQTRRPPARP